MKKIFLIVFLIFIFSSSGGYSQDNIYGDYLFGSFDKKISLDLESAQLVDVLKMLSQQIGLNFISTEAVRGRIITLYMQEVPLREAMDIIFEANNLTYDYYSDSNVFVIKELGKPTLELKTKIYQLKYVRVSSSKMEKEVANMLKSDDSEEGEAAEEVDDSETGIAGAVESVLTEFGKLTEDPITNSLIIVDVPIQFPLIDRIISELDVSPVKILIEVEMMDVAKSHLDQMGFNFENGLTAAFTMGSRETRFPWDNRFFHPVGINTDASELGGAEPTLSTLDLSDFTTVMQFLTEDTETKFIARPKILTLANETAEVNLTLNEVIGVTTTNNEDGTTTQEIERENTGTSLRVTPQVNMDTDEITLVVDVFNKESLDSNIQIEGMTSGFVKNVEERSTKSILRLKAGETLLIGGLLKKEESETITKIPFLGDLPLIGRAFRYRNQPKTDNINRELLVFLTPRILRDTGGFVGKAKTLVREQNNFQKESSMKIALDRHNR
ncbi:MAG: hypothetical protein KAS05_02925 [Candidatus Omnitrophica bacterium]|nr:hypothetical protein [Candidatus Omnitrophota bacterium]